MLTVLMRADYLAPLNRFQRTLVLGSFGTAILAALIAATLATNIVRPLERLSRGAIKIQRGRWDESVAVERGDELGRLSRAMERMRLGIVRRDEQLRVMLAQVAHEIRNPLGGLELFATAALEAEDPEERVRLLDRVRREVEALNDIINDFLTFARPLHPQVKLHDIRGPLREAAELMEFQLEENGGALTVRLPDDPLMARADPDHVKRAILNLLQNAGAGRTESVDGGPGGENGEAVVAVRDDGPGVSGEVRDRIFEAFVTDKAQGAGLGLAIVKASPGDKWGHESCSWTRRQTKTLTNPRSLKPKEPSSEFTFRAPKTSQRKGPTRVRNPGNGLGFFGTTMLGMR